jgi:ubiquinone/menaquinone biosynthesis C-methylase UbiE
LAVAKERASFHQLSHQISFLKINPDGTLPFEDNSFDYVYAESVLAILAHSSFIKLLSEVHRILRKGGKFICNDLIWKTTATTSIIGKINATCLNDFVIIQSCAKPAYLNEWTSTFKQHHFKLEKLHAIISKPQNTEAKKGDGFMFQKKIINVFRLKLQFKAFQFNKLIAKNHSEDSKYLESFMFVLVTT